MALHWSIYTFSELSNHQLYDILKLRTDVFVVEQECPYPELDNKDQDSLHFCGFNAKKELVAYTRIISPGVSYKETSIGRVLIKKSERKFKYGKILMQLSIDIAKRKYPKHNIKIGAQTYLSEFYTNLGFKQTSEPYLEDDIPHIEMIYNVKQDN